MRGTILLLTILDLDADPYWECGSGSRSMEIDQNEQINLVSCLSYRLFYLRRMFLTCCLLKYIFHVKIKLCNLKSDQDPDPH